MEGNSTFCEVIIMKRGETIPAVHVNIASADKVVPAEFSYDDLNAIMNEITVVSGDPIDPNTMLNLARTVAEYYGLQDTVDDINKFFSWVEGNTLTIQRGVMFWMTVFRRLKNDC